MPASDALPRALPALREVLRDPLFMLPLPIDDDADMPERLASRSIDDVPLRDVLPMLLPEAVVPVSVRAVLPRAESVEEGFVEGEYVEAALGEVELVEAVLGDVEGVDAAFVDALLGVEARAVVPEVELPDAVLPLVEVRERVPASGGAPSWPTTPPTPAPTAAPTGPATAAPTTAPVAAPAAVLLSWRSMLFQLAQPANRDATASATALRINLVEFVILISKALDAVRPVRSAARGTELRRSPNTHQT